MQEHDLSERPHLYLAGPLFSEAERSFNVLVRDALSLYCDVYLPQEDGGLLVNMVKRGVPVHEASRRVFETDIRAIDMCDVVLVILDGRAVDEGAAVELGYAYAKGKPCYGMKTDPRQLLQIGNNPMVDGPLEDVFNSLDDVLAWACERLPKIADSRRVINTVGSLGISI